MTIAQLLIGKTPQDKVRILYRVIERLRLRHNEKGDDFRNGVITEEDWKEFLFVWDERFKRVHNILNVIRENQGYFSEQNMDIIQTLKNEGRVLSDSDGDVDIDTM